MGLETTEGWRQEGNEQKPKMHFLAAVCQRTLGLGPQVREVGEGKGCLSSLESADTEDPWGERPTAKTHTNEIIV